MTEEFKVVKRKRGGKNPPGKDGSQDNSLVRTDDAELYNFEALKKRVEEYKQDLRLSEFYQDCCNVISTSLQSNTESDKRADSQHPSLIGYGIGKFSSCPIARYQLAFLLLLQEKLLTGAPVVYDPVFTARDQQFLTELGCDVLSHNEEGKRMCSTPSVLFMPHCGKALYNNLIWTNLSSLHNVYLIGNSFSRMIESTPSRQLKKTANYVMKITPYTKETPLKSSTFLHTDVFNDLSLHVFPQSLTDNAEEDFWQSNLEPSYLDEDVEFIRHTEKKAEGLL